MAELYPSFFDLMLGSCALRGAFLQASSLLESIPKMFAQTQHADACLGAAVQASIDTLKVHPLYTLPFDLWRKSQCGATRECQLVALPTF